MQQGPIAAQDLPVLLGNALSANVTISASGATTLVACPNYASGANPTYRPVIYLKKLEFSTATATSITLQGSDGTVIEGPLQNVATFSSEWDGNLSTNPCAIGSNLQIVLGTAPAAPFTATISYFLN